jgi:nitroimidazol reductase NimA-like FMN-containing flavoprotein (pyridoxamine 5'-phosphate oxidase superfamily)
MNAESGVRKVGGYRRYKELSESECMDRLSGAVIGRIAFTTFGVAVIRPVNFVVDGQAVVFRTAAGSKISPALRRAPVCFEVDHFDPSAGTGWSVIVAGAAGMIRDPERIARIDRALTSWMPGELGHLIAIEIEQITGRQITSAPFR